MMRVLLDTNVVLHVLLDRKPFVEESGQVWEASDAGLFDACIAAFSLPTIHYSCQTQENMDAANRAVDLCLEAFEVTAVYRECVLAARRMPGGDFEDNLQIACAITDFMQGIVTRNPKDFTASPIRVYSPNELMAVVKR